MKILVTGGCGYKGHRLIPKLLGEGYEVIAFDIQWFGNFLPPHPKLRVVQGDILKPDTIPLNGVDTIIHLASIANDPCADLDPKLTWEVVTLATMQLANRARKFGIRRFLYASSGSVYGVKGEEKVTEELSLEPLSEYNKAKMVAERVLLSYQDEMEIYIVRPGTVCGYSPRMRFDVVVNMMVMQALSKGKMTVLGGGQIRPNIHIEDICDVYLHLLNYPEYVGIYNAAFENLSIIEIAKLVQKYLPVEIEIKPSNDPRSYRMNSDKLLRTGFQPKKNVEEAIGEMISQFRGKADEDRYYNVKWMKQTVLTGSIQ